ncbi:MAG: MFS transporter [Faecalibacterium sp.]|nr:MFS transporter [Ruminococcus sp.]MCM1392552.1 MFS transporter [Ruminococcus sp.]MCM1486245.1 MFS transporter [Faecalibacterium sp.]
MKNPIKFFFSKEESDVKVANNRLLSYSAGLAGQNMNYNFVSQRLFVFLNTVLGIPAEKTGWITSISTLWDAINDPIIGTIVDSRKFKAGNKLRPYLIYLPPIIGILTALMFFDFGMTEMQAIVFIIAVYLAIDILYSFQDVALWGMISLSSPNSDERARVSQWVTIGAGAGSTVAGFFPSVRQILVDGGITTEKSAYFLGGVLFGLGGMLVSMLAYRMKEKVHYEPEKKNSVLQNLLSLRHNKTLIIICLARFVGALSLTLPWEYFFETEGIKYSIFGAELSGGTMQVVYTMLPGIPGALMMFFAAKFAKKIGGMKRVLVVSEVVQIILRVIAFAIGNNDRFLNIGVMISIMCIIAIINIPVSMKDIAHRALISDSIDEVELKTGERTEGIAFSMQNFVSKASEAVKKLIQGYLLKFLKFDGNVKRPNGVNPIKYQTGKFVKYRWHQFMLGPVVGSLLYLIVILFLDDNREHMKVVEQQLKEKRENAEANLVAAEVTE